MIGRDEGEERFLAPPGCGKTGGKTLGSHADKGHVELAAGEVGELFRGREVMKLQAHLGMPLGEMREDRDQFRREHRADESHLDPVGLAAGGPLRRLARAPEPREDVARLGAEGAARRSERDTAARPFEEGDAEGLLERPDVSRERRLGETEPLRRPGEGEFLGHREKNIRAPAGKIHSYQKGIILLEK